MTYTWVWDAPSGTYKQHALSSKIYDASIEKSVFMDHVVPVDGYGRRMGENVTLQRVSNITEPESAVLTEGVPISEDEFSLTTTTVTPQELGRAIPYTSLADDLSDFDIESPIQRKLRQQMTLVLDTLAAAAFKQLSVKYVPSGLAESTTETTLATTATSNMNVFHVEEIRDYLFDTLHVPPAEDSDYIGIFRTKSLRGIKRDPSWEEWHKYTNPTAKFNGEVGRIENIRFVETNHAKALGLKGTGSVLGEGVVFGEDAVAMGEVMTPELRAAVPGDFGRQKAVAWYGILGFNLIWDTANAGEAKGVHVTSA